MDDFKRYKSVAIPRPGDLPEAGRANAARPANGWRERPQTGPNFAEVEIGADSKPVSGGVRAARVFLLAPDPEPVVLKERDPVREKFYQMRRLSYGRSFARFDYELFYKQAKLLEEFSDDYTGFADMLTDCPHYQLMGYDQLRTYFTWRTKARAGNAGQIPISYMLLYIYEIINNIGVADPTDGLNKLVEIYEKISVSSPELQKLMLCWIKDYHIYYGLTQRFSDFVEKHDLFMRYPSVFINNRDFDARADIWLDMSKYNISRSKFCSSGKNAALLRDCLKPVLDGIDVMLQSHGLRLKHLIMNLARGKSRWQPFAESMFHCERKQPDREIDLLGSEKYYCIENRWYAEIPVFKPDFRDFAAYIVKKTESCLRRETAYKHKLTARYGGMEYGCVSRMKVMGVDFGDIDAVIEKAVSEVCRRSSRIVVTVDESNLNRIRAQARGTQEKLVVPEEPQVNRDRDDENAVISTPPESSPAEAAHDFASGDESAGDGIVSDNWNALINMLTPAEKSALSAIAGGDFNMGAFAHENGIMTEVLIDGINEKAFDCIGDSVVDTGGAPFIYDEYAQKIVEMVGLP